MICVKNTNWEFEWNFSRVPSVEKAILIQALFRLQAVLDAKDSPILEAKAKEWGLGHSLGAVWAVNKLNKWK